MSIISSQSCTARARRRADRFVPPVECFPWCEHRNGHPREWTPEDQTCCAASPEIPTGDGHVESYAVHHHAQGASRVAVGLFPDDARHGCEMQLNVADALTLAGQIVDAATLLVGPATTGQRLVDVLHLVAGRGDNAPHCRFGTPGCDQHADPGVDGRIVDPAPETLCSALIGVAGSLDGGEVAVRVDRWTDDATTWQVQVMVEGPELLRLRPDQARRVAELQVRAADFAELLGGAV